MNINKLYKEIARKHNTPAKEVKKEIENSIKYAYFTNSNADIFKNGLPTNEQFTKWTSEKTKIP